MIDKEKIRMFITNHGVVIGQEYSSDEYSSGKIKLNHPLRIVPHQGDLVIASLFIKEEWCIMPTESVVEISITDEILNLYIDKESQLFGSILMPSDKKIIL